MREHELTDHRSFLSRARSLFLNLNLNLILCQGTLSDYSVNRWPSTSVNVNLRNRTGEERRRQTITEAFILKKSEH